MNIDVLVVDDDADLRAPLVELLRDEGFTVDEAADGEGLLEALALRRPLLVLLDLTLPGPDLHAVFAEAKSRHLTAGRTIVALTGLDDASRLADELGLDGVLRKPFDVDELVALVHTCCRRAATPRLADRETAHSML